ncbi:MAG TPA: DUF6531 domain-containing protein [Bacteriovoracaceae bacterium]|nr:DUF6531 domain-containing protein [Bacteriovoracaceae bacterium]
MNNFKIFIIPILAILVSASTLAGVNLKNGNFYISYTDIKVPGGGHDLEITRTYNSKSADKGWFGVGWGSDYETFLNVGPDGSIVIYENGSGAQTRFTSKESINVEDAAKKIVDAMRKTSELSENVAQDLMKKLKGDEVLRRTYAQKYKVKSEFADGTILYSNVRGIQTVKKHADGFVRSYSDGRSENFNLSGKLIKVSDKNGYSVTLNYNKGNTLESIKDSQGKQLFFEWYPDSKVKNIWSAGDKKTVYKYDGDNLVESLDVEDNVYKYQYDSNHNMTKITYSNLSTLEIAYDRKMQFVSEITTRTGEKTKYSYGSNPQNPQLHYWTEVSKVGKDGKIENDSTNKYEYEMKVRPDGSQYTYRIVTGQPGFETETIYSECCSLPLKITRGKHVTNFEYNDKGLLVKKSSTKGEFVALTYHETFNKITRVVNNDGWTNFEYDKNGNLYKAENGAGKAVLLIYDSQGRITKMVDHEKSTGKKRSLSFIYNALGKPVEISMDNVGKINVVYDNYGEIKKVEPQSGHKMALEVTQAFQSLLSIVKPAGVNLNM